MFTKSSVLFSEFSYCILPLVLRLLPSKIFHIRKCKELCFIQEKYGIEINFEVPFKNGLSDYIWHTAGWSLWDSTDQEKVGLF